MGIKRFNIKYRVGKAKYLLSFHDGKKRHNDNSDFFDIAIFSNKIKLNKFTKDLVNNGYIYSNF